MPADRGDLTPAETPDHVLATYREIAVRFGLGGPNAGRTKAKRAGWATETSNHPGDPVRVQVPRDVWSQGPDTPPLTVSERPPLSPAESPPLTAPETRALTGRDGGSQKGPFKTFEVTLTLLRDLLARAHDRAEKAELHADIRIRQAREQVNELRDALHEMREQRDDLRDRLAATESRASNAEDELRTLGAEAAALTQKVAEWTRGPRWRRLREALRRR